VASFAKALWQGQPPNEVIYHAVSQPARVLPLTNNGDRLRVTIPEVGLWGILAFGNAPEG
jgi:hypothetical protein